MSTGIQNRLTEGKTPSTSGWHHLMEEVPGLKKSKGESQWPIRIHGSLLHDGDISDRCLVRLTSPSLTTNQNKSFSFTVLLAIVTAK